jgi:hypothetical protein
MKCIGRFLLVVIEGRLLMSILYLEQGNARYAWMRERDLKYQGHVGIPFVLSVFFRFIDEKMIGLIVHYVANLW